jgi:hypothetical protein
MVEHPAASRCAAESRVSSRLVCRALPILRDFAQGLHDVIDFGLRNRDRPPAVFTKRR